MMLPCMLLSSDYPPYFLCKEDKKRTHTRPQFKHRTNSHKRRARQIKFIIMSNNASVVAGTVIVEIVDDGSSFRGGGGQNNNTNTHATTNNDERNYEKRETRVRRSSSGPSSTSLPTTTNNNNTQTRRATRVVQNATVFVNETVEQFLERCLERRKSRDKEDLINATTKTTISSTFGTGGGKRNVSVPQLFWSSCPLSAHERLDKLESTKPWQLNLKKGDSRLTLRVKDFQEWTVSVKRMTSAKNPLVVPRAEEKEKEKGGEQENAGEKGG